MYYVLTILALKLTFVTKLRNKCVYKPHSVKKGTFKLFTTFELQKRSINLPRNYLSVFDHFMGLALKTFKLKLN